MSIEKFFKSVLIAFLMIPLGLAQSLRESFDYAPNVLDGLGEAVDGWGGPWTIFAGSPEIMYVVEGSLEMSGIPTSGNSLMGSMTSADGDERAYREIVDIWPDIGNSYWISYLMNVNNISFNEQSWQGVSLYLSDTELVLFGKVWGLPNYGLMAHTLGGTATTSLFTWEDGLVWTVIRINMSGDTQNERCFMWINPSPASEPDTSLADVIADLQLNDGFDRVVIHFGRNIDLEASFDEVRLGTSFQDVSSQYTGVGVDENQRVNQFELSNNYPNPFNPVTRIDYQIPQTANVNISVYNSIGQLVTVLVDEMKSPGKYSVSWNATNQNGLKVPSGIYIARMAGNNYSATRKLTLLK